MLDLQNQTQHQTLHERIKLNSATSSRRHFENCPLKFSAEEQEYHTAMFVQPPNKTQNPKKCSTYVKNKYAVKYRSLDAAVPSTLSNKRIMSSDNLSENNQHIKMQIKTQFQKHLKSLKLKKHKSRNATPTGISVLQTFLARQFQYVKNNHIPALFTQHQSNTIPLSLHNCKATKPALKSPPAKIRKKSRLLPGLGATSFFTLITFIFLEMILLSTVSNCAKTFYMHWNTSNSIFRIDNTDHIIDVNKGNLAFEFDQVHIICPVYEPGTFENETEKYIIYNVSKVEYETCRITNTDPRVIAICDKPQKLMFFTITFRPFTPQPGGLEFLPGNDYYFISTSSKDDLYRRIGGRCSTNNMKVVFKVCCAPEEKNKTTTTSTTSAVDASGNSDADVQITHDTMNNNQQHHNNINSFGAGGININSANGHNNGIQLKPLNVGGGGSTGTSINTNIDQFNRIPMQTGGINVIGHNIGVGGTLGGNNGILLTAGGNHGGINMIPAVGGGSPYHPAIGEYHPHPHQTTSGIRINNVPSHKHNINNNGKEVEEQEYHNGGGDGGVSGVGGGNGVNIGKQLTPQFLPPVIDTNHSNIVQSTVNWPPTQHWSGNSNIYYNHDTNQNIQNQNILANEKKYHSPPHRPQSTTSTTTNHNKINKNQYDKHPNEVVKNEELTYNSAGSSIIHGNYWTSWKKLFVQNNFYWKATAVASRNSLSYYLDRVEGFGTQALSKLENFLLQLLKHPFIFLTVFFVTIAQSVFLRSATFKNCNANTSSLTLSINAEICSKKEIKIDDNNSYQQQQQKQQQQLKYEQQQYEQHEGKLNQMHMR